MIFTICTAARCYR